MAANRYAYAYGNTARQLPAEQEVKQPVRKKRKIRVKRVKTSARPKLTFAIFAVAVFFTVFRFTMINERTAQATSLRRELQEITAANEQASVALNCADDLKKVEEVAKTELGMNYPQAYQIVNVTLQQEDKAVKTDASAPSGNHSLGAFFGRILEYLY